MNSAEHPIILLFSQIAAQAPALATASQPRRVAGAAPMLYCNTTRSERVIVEGAAMSVRSSYLNNQLASGGRVRAMRAASWVIIMLLVVLGMAGCGVAGGSAGAASSPGVAAPASPGTPAGSATAAATPKPGGPIANAPCSAASQPATTAGNPALVLTPLTHSRAGGARVGDIVQVRLPDTSRWQYIPSQPATALVPVSPSGVFVPALHACVWSFQAVSVGGQMLRFVGQAICPPGRFCANHALALAFSVSIS